MPETTTPSAHAPDPRPLRAWLDAVQPTHADDPGAVADALLQRAAALPADADGAEAIRLAEHLFLAHLAAQRPDAQGLLAFLARLPAALAQAEPTAAALRRTHWALAVLRGQAQPALDETTRWRALQNVVLALAARGQAVRAAALLDDETPAGLAAGPGGAGQSFAASCNNVASELQYGPRGDAARDALMLQAAGLSRQAWAEAGTWQHVERAEYRLALCHAVLGQGEAALRHARACLAGCMAAGAEADAVEHYFAHEALARAQLASGDTTAARTHAAQMRALLPQISTDGGLRDWCAGVLADLPTDLPA